MKAFATILLTFSIFVQTFRTYVIQAEFYLNRAYIAKNLCVNKDKPMMHCNGNCYLSRKIKEQEKQDQQAPAPKNERLDATPFFVPQPIGMEKIVCATEIHYFIKNEGTLTSFPRSLFHPPAVQLS